MTTAQVCGWAALALYTVLAWWQWPGHTAGRATFAVRQPAMVLIVLALLLHGLSVYALIDTPAGFHFGFFRVASLICWVMTITLVASSVKLPVSALLSPMFAMAAVGIGFSELADSAYQPRALGDHIALHIVLSILAYSLLALAAVQALALAMQDHLLKTRQLQRAMAFLPPLQTMEALLFEMLWAGTVLLALSVLTGFLFFDNMREQHLVHKMFFSVLALLLYSTLLWGRHVRGWRGRQALRWTLGGFVALMLAYFGTKLVLELLLAN